MYHEKLCRRLDSICKFKALIAMALPTVHCTILTILWWRCCKPNPQSLCIDAVNRGFWSLSIQWRLEADHKLSMLEGFVIVAKTICLGSSLFICRSQNIRLVTVSILIRRYTDMKIRSKRKRLHVVIVASHNWECANNNAMTTTTYSHLPEQQKPWVNKKHRHQQTTSTTIKGLEQCDQWPIL